MPSRDAGLALPGVPQGECGTRGRQAVPYGERGGWRIYEPLFKLCDSSANRFDRIASGLELEHAKQFQVGQYLNPMRGAETSHLFRVEISIPSTDDVGIAVRRQSHHHLLLQRQRPPSPP